MAKNIKPEPRRLGRPPKLVGWVTRNVVLEPKHIETAEHLGGGNVSAGIRKALERASDDSAD